MHEPTPTFAYSEPASQQLAKSDVVLSESEFGMGTDSPNRDDSILSYGSRGSRTIYDEYGSPEHSIVSSENQDNEITSGFTSARGAALTDLDFFESEPSVLSFVEDRAAKHPSA